MTPSQFYQLDEAEQAEVLWDGKHIADRQDEEHNILLYQCGDLYVEVFFHRKFNVIRKFEEAALVPAARLEHAVAVQEAAIVDYLLSLK